MFNFKENAVPFALSLVLHVTIGVLFVMSIDFRSKARPLPQAEVNVIEAVAVDESRVQAELDKLKKIDQRKRDEEDRRQRELESDAQRAKRQREAEEERLADVKKKKEQEKQSLAELEKKKKVDTERAAKLQKEREELEAKKKEDQKAADQAALKRKMEEDAARDKQRAEEERKKKAAEQLAQDKEVKKAVASFEAQIKAKVESAWIKPTNFAPGSACTVSVKLIPTGDVVDSKLSSCTGGDIFSRSVEAAVQKAQPLPVSKDPAVFDRMRDIDFVFRPQ